MLPTLQNMSHTATVDGILLHGSTGWFRRAVPKLSVGTLRLTNLSTLTVDKALKTGDSRSLSTVNVVGEGL